MCLWRNAPVRSLHLFPVVTADRLPGAPGPEVVGVLRRARLSLLATFGISVAALSRRFHQASLMNDLAVFDLVDTREKYLSPLQVLHRLCLRDGASPAAAFGLEEFLRFAHDLILQPGLAETCARARHQRGYIGHIHTR